MRRTPRDKSHPTNGTTPTRANKQLFLRPGRAITNSGRLSVASTMSMAIAICSAPAPRSRSSKNRKESALCFRRQFRGADSSGNKAQCAAVRSFSRSGAGFVVFGVTVHLPQIVKLCVSEDIFHAQHRCHHSVVLVVVFMYAVAANQVEVRVPRIEFLTNGGD